MHRGKCIINLSDINDPFYQSFSHEFSPPLTSRFLPSGIFFFLFFFTPRYKIPIIKKLLPDGLFGWASITAFSLWISSELTFFDGIWTFFLETIRNLQYRLFKLGNELEGWTLFQWRKKNQTHWSTLPVDDSSSSRKLTLVSYFPLITRLVSFFCFT